MLCCDVHCVLFGHHPSSPPILYIWSFLRMLYKFLLGINNSISGYNFGGSKVYPHLSFSRVMYMVVVVFMY